MALFTTVGTFVYIFALVAECAGAIVLIIIL